MINHFLLLKKEPFLINANESYNSFKIRMTKTNTIGDWALCLGQIEVFGDIYPTSYYPIPGKYRCMTHHYHFGYSKPFSQIILLCLYK